MFKLHTLIVLLFMLKGCTQIERAEKKVEIITLEVADEAIKEEIKELKD